VPVPVPVPLPLPLPGDVYGAAAAPLSGRANGDGDRVPGGAYGEAAAAVGAYGGVPPVDGHDCGGGDVGAPDGAANELVDGGANGFDRGVPGWSG
jgi:hypothetical protein